MPEESSISKFQLHVSHWNDFVSGTRPLPVRELHDENLGWQFGWGESRREEEPRTFLEYMTAIQESARERQKDMPVSFTVTGIYWDVHGFDAENTTALIEMLYGVIVRIGGSVPQAHYGNNLGPRSSGVMSGLLSNSMPDQPFAFWNDPNAPHNPLDQTTLDITNNGEIDVVILPDSPLLQEVLEKPSLLRLWVLGYFNLYERWDG